VKEFFQRIKFREEGKFRQACFLDLQDLKIGLEKCKCIASKPNPEFSKTDNMKLPHFGSKS
jgi:hypothetical protein